MAEMKRRLPRGPRGHAVRWDGQSWRYADNDELVWESGEQNRRACIRCHMDPTPEGYDACIGLIPGLNSVCCGHGNRSQIGTSDGRYFSGTWLEVETWLAEEGLRPLRSIVANALNRYPEDADQAVSALRGKGELSVDDVLTAIRWGYARRPEQLARSERLLRRVGDSNVQRMSSYALASEVKIERIRRLTSIRTVGLPTASIIYSAVDPDVPIMSHYSLAALERLRCTNIRPVRRASTKRGYPILRLSFFLSAFQRLRTGSGMSTRELDRALYVYGGGPTSHVFRLARPATRL